MHAADMGHGAANSGNVIGQGFHQVELPVPYRSNDTVSDFPVVNCIAEAVRADGGGDINLEVYVNEYILRKIPFLCTGADPAGDPQALYTNAAVEGLW